MVKEALENVRYSAIAKRLDENRLVRTGLILANYCFIAVPIHMRYNIILQSVRATGVPQ